MNSFTFRPVLLLALLSLLVPLTGGAAANDGVASKPLFRDSVRDGATDEFQNESRYYLRSDVGYAVQENLRIEFGGFKYVLEARDGVRFDFIFGYRLNPWFSIEAESGMAFTRLNDAGKHDYYQVPFLANLAWNYPGEKLRPFISLGGGGVELIAVTRSSTYSGPTTSDFVPCGQFAAGIHYRLTKHFEAGLGYKVLVVTRAKLDYAAIDQSRTHSFFASLRYDF